MAHRGYRDSSRDDWGRDSSETIDREQIKLGAILRIADATEAMAREHTALIRDLDYYKKLSADQLNEIERLRHSRAAYKAHLTRMKKKFSQLQKDNGTN